jgi:para-nitrobenzyl esterase
MHVELPTPQGTVRGHQRADHQAFLGIPFAAPPVGELRFAAPAPAPTWAGVRDALAFSPVCPQPTESAATARGEQNEDCLYLNVFTPRGDGSARPVMVWIHGGGFTTGAGSEATYDGGALAARGDVVVVTINYRLGALGYLYFGGHGGESWNATSNAGQLDQIAALRWVQANIAAYGGDPAQVTIFGESAGGVAVNALMTMPAARGLFVRAIAQSGTANRLGGADLAMSTTHAFLKQLGTSHADPAQLRALPWQALLDAQLKTGPLTGLFWPVVDGQHVPERPLTAIRDGRARNIPLLVGTNRDEAKFYATPKREPISDSTLEQRVRAILPHRARERVPEVVAGYRSSRMQRNLPHTNNDLLDAIDTAARFAVPASRMAEAQAAHQPKTFMYLFDWESPVKRLGACHALELSFVFGTLSAPGNDRFAGAGPEAEKLSGQMMDAWIAFAKTGDPSCGAVGPWPRYDGERNTMIFGRNTRLERAPFEEERALWASLL